MTQKEELRKLKVYTINKLKKIERLVQPKNKEWLTVTEVTEEFSISRKTFDRLREKGLEVSQPKRNGKILVNRNDFTNFLIQKT